MVGQCGGSCVLDELQFVQIIYQPFTLYNVS